MTEPEHYLFKDDQDEKNFSTHRVTVNWSQTSSKRKLEIFVSAGSFDQAARLWGTIEGPTAYLEHMEAGRFPPGKGVGYFMIHRFAEEILKYCNPEPRVCLGTPVNHKSVNAAAQDGQEVSGERAALHIYQLCGFNVTTADLATTSQVTAGELCQRMAPRIQRWSKLDEVSL